MLEGNGLTDVVIFFQMGEFSRDCLPQTITIEDAAQTADFIVYGPGRFLRGKPLAAVGKDVIAGEIADEPVAKLGNERSHALLVSGDSLFGEPDFLRKPSLRSHAKQRHGVAALDSVDRRFQFAPACPFRFASKSSAAAFARFSDRLPLKFELVPPYPPAFVETHRFFSLAALRTRCAYARLLARTCCLVVQ